MSTQGTIPPSQSIHRRRFVDKLLSAPVGAAAAALMLTIFLGCMSLEIGNRKVERPPCEEGVLFQQGEAHVPGNSTKFVRYPIPYPRKPNIEISSTFDDCEITDERADGFLLENPNSISRTVTWKARGMRLEPPPAAPPAPVPVTPTLPPPTPERNN